MHPATRGVVCVTAMDMLGEMLMLGQVSVHTLEWKIHLSNLVSPEGYLKCSLAV